MNAPPVQLHCSPLGRDPIHALPLRSRPTFLPLGRFPCSTRPYPLRMHRSIPLHSPLGRFPNSTASYHYNTYQSRLFAFGQLSTPIQLSLYSLTLHPAFAFGPFSKFNYFTPLHNSLYHSVFAFGQLSTSAHTVLHSSFPPPIFAFGLPGFPFSYTQFLYSTALYSSRSKTDVWALTTSVLRDEF